MSKSWVVCAMDNYSLRLSKSFDEKDDGASLKSDKSKNVSVTNFVLVRRTHRDRSIKEHEKVFLCDSHQVEIRVSTSACN